MIRKDKMEKRAPEYRVASTHKVRSEPIISLDGSCRGWVRLHEDRIGHAKQTEYCLTIDVGGYVSPYEARLIADRLCALAAVAEQRLPGADNLTSPDHYTERSDDD